MNKKIALIFVGVILLIGIAYVFITADRSPSIENDVDVKVSVTLFPAYDIARIVGGDRVNVQLILPPGASPHTFDPTPSTLRQLQGSDVFFAIGHGVDDWVDGIAENISGAKVMHLDRGIVLREYAERDNDHDQEEHADEDHADHDEEGHHHEGEDPHYWLNPAHGIVMAETIAQTLVEIDPKNKDFYIKNAAIFTADMERRNARWQSTLANLSSREVVTFHDAFGYFAEHFNLEVVATFEPFPGKQPTPSYLREITEVIEEHGIRGLFIEPQLDGATLEQFAKDVRVTVATIDPIGGVDGRDSYAALIDFNVQAIERALK